MKIKNPYQLFAIIFILIGFLISITYIFLIVNRNKLNLNESIDINMIGSFGDFIGGVVGSLWTLAGVFLFFQALREQRQDVETNMELLKTQISGLETTKEIAEEQASILRVQQFESTFFSLFNFFIDSTKDLKFEKFNENSKEYEIVEGKKVFSSIVEDLNNTMPSDKHYGNWTDVMILLKFESIYANKEESLQAYFGVLSNLLKLIEESGFRIDIKYTYSKIIRATLTNSELLVLHYYRQINSDSNITLLLKEFNLLGELKISIRPEFNYHRLNLSELTNDDKTRPVNLEAISTAFYWSLLKTILYCKDHSFEPAPSSHVYITTKKRESIIVAQIEIPTNKFLKYIFDETKQGDLYSDYNDVPYSRSNQKLREYDLCGLIEDLFFTEMVVDNYNFVDTKYRNVLSDLYSVKSNVSESDDGNYLVFKCEFDFKFSDKIWVKCDLDDIAKKIAKDTYSNN